MFSPLQMIRLLIMHGKKTCLKVMKLSEKEQGQIRLSTIRRNIHTLRMSVTTERKAEIMQITLI